MYHQQPPYPGYDFFQKLEEKINKMTELNKETIKKFEEKLESLEEENKELKQKVEEMKPINIENINYKIQELSVQELSGTLNVGLTSLADSEELKELIKSANGKDFKLEDIDDEDEPEQQPLPNNQVMHPAQPIPKPF